MHEVDVVRLQPPELREFRRVLTASIGSDAVLHLTVGRSDRLHGTHRDRNRHLLVVAEHKSDQRSGNDDRNRLGCQGHSTTYRWHFIPFGVENSFDNNIL
ncbi:MAG TPA: hypothetical protein VK497_04975 [Candidatus Saccharimonadales bacterium]|nr:hypothetical protein [Candidatus Saccharimonadales bacterium]